MNTPAHTPEPWVSIDDVAAHVGVRRDSIYRWIERRGLPATKVGKLWKLKLSEVDAWMRARNGRRRAEPAATPVDGEVVGFGETFVGMLGEELHAITSAAGMLGRGALRSRDLARPVGRILTSADRMERIIAQLQDYMRIRLGHGIALERASVELGDIVRAVRDELSSTQRRRLRLEQGGDARGSWDSERLVQLLSSLVGFAFGRSRPGSPIAVEIDGADADVVHLVLRHDGALSRSEVAHVFDPPREARRGGSGLGLDLYIGRQIALAHGGTIRVDVDRGRSTSFRVTLPRGEGSQR